MKNSSNRFYPRPMRQSPVPTCTKKIINDEKIKVSQRRHVATLNVKITLNVKMFT